MNLPCGKRSDDGRRVIFRLESGANITITGVISGKSFLPITRLNISRIQLASSSGVHTLGRFECTGQVAVSGMPKPCVDLWRIGHSLSGLYSMMGEKQVESVYCDFIKLPTDSGKSYVIDGSLKM